MKIAEQVIQKIKDENDIVDVISENVKLKRSGKYYTGLCPFHHEKTPSFTVTQEKQIYKCFGCGEAGNVITYIMKAKNMSFYDAVIYLADRAHIEIEYEDAPNNSKRDFYEKIYKINVDAARFFFNNLSNNKNAMQYFINRKISNTTIRRFGLGYAVSEWRELIKYLHRKGYTELDMLNAGLIIKNDKNIYDRFRNRVIFPVFDYRGRVIGFGGRVLDDSKPKYLNSPETVIFKKGVNLYGLNFALKDNNKGIFIIVEGYMDCISLHQYGITNVVASLGTALTTAQAKLLKKYADKVIISYDADTAGQNATLRGLNILKDEGFDVRVLTVPEGKDPDEFVKKNGKEAFNKLIYEALPLTDYRMNRIKEGFNLKNREMTVKYAEKSIGIINELNSVEKDVYIKKLSEETGITPQALYDSINDKNANNLQQLNISGNFGQKLYLEPPCLKGERNLLYLMLKGNEYYTEIEPLLEKEDMIIDSHKKIYKLIKENIHEENYINRIEIGCNDIETSKEWVKITNSDISEYLTNNDKDIKQLIDDYILGIKKYKLEESKKNIMIKIKDCENKGLIQESLQLASKLIEIQKQIGNLLP